MCKYEYYNRKKGNTLCIYPKFYEDLKKINLSDIDLPLPIDEDGYCIFHSSNIEWKKDNNFTKYFLDLLRILNQQAIKRKENKESRGTFDFSGFKFVWDDEIIDFSELQFLENAKFNNAVFYEKFLLNNTTFINGCQFETSQFYKNVEIKNSTFSDTAIFEKSIFNEGFSCINSKFENYTLFTSSIFKKKFVLQKCSFDNFVMFDDINFENKLEYALFDFLTFNEVATVDFSNTKFNGLVRFKEITFNADVSFNNCDFSLLQNTNPLNCSVSFEMIKIKNNAFIQFKGDKPYYRMFKNDVSFTFQDDIIGKIYFMNVDFGSIHHKTIDEFKFLEEKKQLEIGNGCIKDRVNNINIFIASQEILNQEREFIENKILRKNLSFVPKNILMTPIRWEQRDKSNNGNRKQDEYLRLISDSEIFILIIWNSIGKYTREEFDYAYFERDKGRNPKLIYIFNKINNNEFDNNFREDAFPDFIEKLKDKELIIPFSENISISDELDHMFDEIEKKYKV